MQFSASLRQSHFMVPPQPSDTSPHCFASFLGTCAQVRGWQHSVLLLMHFSPLSQPVHVSLTQPVHTVPQTLPCWAQLVTGEQTPQMLATPLAPQVSPAAQVAGPQ